MSENKKTLRAGDVMQPQFIEMDGLMTVADALAAMADGHTNTLIINKRHDDDEFGIVLLSDIAKKVLVKNRAPERVNLYEIMSKPVIAVDERMDVRYVARLFDQFGLSRAPVIREGRVVGMVSNDDLVLRGLMKLRRS